MCSGVMHWLCSNFQSRLLVHSVRPHWLAPLLYFAMVIREWHFFCNEWSNAINANWKSTYKHLGGNMSSCICYIRIKLVKSCKGDLFKRKILTEIIIKCHRVIRTISDKPTMCSGTVPARGYFTNTGVTSRFFRLKLSTSSDVLNIQQLFMPKFIQIQNIFT